ncbi:MAG: YfiR family protein, partial [Bacteroidetes bacterium]|nr:YfiR family protein [Bacteroidota bacterium]
MKEAILTVAILLCLALSVNLSAQNLERHKAISAYIYNFAKNVEWENEEALKEFHFLVIGEDQDLVREMKVLAQSRTLRNKPIRISSLPSFREIDNVQLIFISKDKRDNHVEIFDKIEGRNILLVSDGYEDKRLVMINFIESSKGTLKFEINRLNLAEQRIRIMEDMVLLGGTAVDVAALYREGQQSLR